MSDRHQSLSLPALRAAGSGSHVIGTAEDMTWQLSDQGKREEVSQQTSEPESEPEWQWIGWRGDPAEIVAASERDPLELLRRLADLVPAWHADAVCAGEPVGIFFPGLGERTTLAYELCGRCPVRVQCLTWAIDEQIDHGVFGGMSPAARRAHARTRRNAGE